jgi:glycosyltransferase involved in cell wall biosynthesis
VTPPPPARQPTVCFPFIGHVVGGSHLSSLLLIDGLRERGVSTVVAVHRSGPLTDLLTERSVPWHVVPVPDWVWSDSLPRHLGGLVASARSLRAFLREHGVSLVHTNDARIHRLWGPTAKATGARWVWHHRSPGISRTAALLATRADAILTVSQYSRRRLRPSLRARTVVIDNPFEHRTGDRLPARLALAAEFGCQPDTPIVGYVSNLRQARKRPEAFIEVASALWRRHEVDALFPMFGAATRQIADQVTARCASLGLQDRCRLMGARVPIEPWLAACDLLVVPAIEEPFGRTLVEAAMAGVPVVAADDGGHPEVIEDGVTGFLFPPADIEAAAAGAARLLADPELARRIADAAGTAARTRFSTERHVDQVLQVYGRLHTRGR